jgi:uncharacterized protein
MGRRLNALFEVVMVFILILIIPMLSIQALKQLWPYNLTIIYDLVFAAIILIVLVTTRRDLSQYGISLSNFNGDLRIVAICIIPLLITQIPTFIFNMGSLAGTLIYCAGELIVLFIIAKILTSVPDKNDKANIRTRIVIPVICLIAITGASIFSSTALPSLIFEFVLLFVFVGPVEELIFRGYMQSRLNDSFGRPYRFFGINLGAGIVITSLLFGMWHVFQYPFNPFAGNYSLALFSGFGAFFMGLTLGVIREKAGSIVAPAILHSTFDLVMEFTMHLGI